MFPDIMQGMIKQMTHARGIKGLRGSGEAFGTVVEPRAQAISCLADGCLGVRCGRC